MDKAELIGERLDQIIAEQKITKAELAKITGVTPQAVNNWYKNGKISIDSAVAINAKYGYRVEWILGSGNYASTNIGNQTISGSSVNITTANQINHGAGLVAQPEQDASHTHRIDYLDVRAAAGLTGFENSDYPEIVSSLFLSDEGLLQIIGRKSAAGIKIVNVPTDSMEPTIRKGDWVFLDTNIDYYNGDGVYAFAIDNALFIKRIQKLVGGGYRLHSDNKDYDPQDITEEICQTAKFVGRFIKTIHIDVVSL